VGTGSSSGAARAPPEVEVLDRAERGHEAEVLVDEVQLGVAQVAGGVTDLDDRAGVGVVQARQDLDERRLARSVLPDDRDDLAGGDLKRHAVERLEPWERLRQAGDPQERSTSVLRSGDGLCAVSGGSHRRATLRLPTAWRTGPGSRGSRSSRG